MTETDPAIKAEIIKYCASIGRDPLLVQGAGGNVSWKEGDTLWIKASGTWLARADKEDIFIPVDLADLRFHIARKNFSASPAVQGSVELRPSIETMLHALLPHRVVVHIHAIDALTHLVRPDVEDFLLGAINERFAFAVVDYFKPGADLAAAAEAALNQNPAAGVIFLKNHGLVVGGESVTAVRQLLKTVIGRLPSKPIGMRARAHAVSMLKNEYASIYSPVPDFQVHQLALDDRLYSQLNDWWALYPDHIVFLGSKPNAYGSWTDFTKEMSTCKAYPELIFIRHEGVYVSPSFNKAKLAQLRCYFDVMVRQIGETRLSTLNLSQVGELLNWDAERYRMRLAK